MTDDEARAAGFLSAADMAQYIEAMREDADIQDWIEAGAPSLRTLWAERTDPPVELVPLTVDQAARKLNVSTRTVRRRLPALVAMTPPGARRIGTGPRAQWRILPAALDGLLTADAVEPEKAAPPKPRPSKPTKKRSATRWEV